MRKTIPVCGQYGVVKDQPTQELPVNAWSDARNIRFRGGIMRRMEGQSQIFATPAVTPYFVMAHQITTKRYWVHAGLAKVYVDDGTTRTEITGTAPTGAIDNKWTGGTLSGILVLNNGVDKPTYWDGNVANNLATLTGWDANELCYSICVFKGFLVALNITKSGTNYPYMVKWSAAALPGAVPASWDETDVTKDAGEQDEGETGDTIVDGRPLGDSFIIYKQHSRLAMRQTFDARVFSFQRLQGAGGALARGCVVEAPGGHFVFGNGDIYMHAGGEPVSIVDAVNRDYIFGSIDSTNAQRSFVVSNTPHNEVWFCFPESGQSSCTLAYCYNYKDKTHYFRTLPNVTDADSGMLAYAEPTIDSMTLPIDSYTNPIDYNPYSSANQRMIMATTAPMICLADSGVTFAGTAFTAYVERVGLVPDDDPSRVKVLNKIVPRIIADTGTVVLIEAGGSMSAEEAPQWTFSCSYTAGIDREAYGFATGKFLSVRFSSTSGAWAIKSYDLEFEDGGAY